MAKVPEAQVAVFGPPPVRGAGRAGGFAFMIEDRGDLGLTELQKQTENMVRRANTPADVKVQDKPGGGLVGVFSVFRANVPQLHIEADNRECVIKGVSLKDFADTLAIYQGSLYVNDFNLFGRTWQVIVQADYRFRGSTRRSESPQGPQHLGQHGPARLAVADPRASTARWY